MSCGILGRLISSRPTSNSIGSAARKRFLSESDTAMKFTRWLHIAISDLTHPSVLPDQKIKEALMLQLHQVFRCLIEDY